MTEIAGQDGADGEPLSVTDKLGSCQLRFPLPRVLRRDDVAGHILGGGDDVHRPGGDRAVGHAAVQGRAAIRALRKG